MKEMEQLLRQANVNYNSAEFLHVPLKVLGDTHTHTPTHAHTLQSWHHDQIVIIEEKLRVTLLTIRGRSAFSLGTLIPRPQGGNFPTRENSSNWQNRP